MSALAGSDRRSQLDMESSFFMSFHAYLFLGSFVSQDGRFVGEEDSVGFATGLPALDGAPTP